MSQLTERTFLSCNKVNTVYVRSRLPEGPVRATLQIAHGLAEYIDRYDEFMDYLMTVDELEFYDEIDCDDLFEGSNHRERIMIFELPDYEFDDEN